jgi:hypothetical protein
MWVHVSPRNQAVTGAVNLGWTGALTTTWNIQRVRHRLVISCWRSKGDGWAGVSLYPRFTAPVIAWFLGLTWSHTPVDTKGPLYHQNHNCHIESVMSWILLLRIRLWYIFNLKIDQNRLMRTTNIYWVLLWSALYILGLCISRFNQSQIKTMQEKKFVSALNMYRFFLVIIS